MMKLLEQLRKARRLWVCGLIAALSFVVFFTVWQLAVRPNAAKSLSVKLCDSYDTVSETVTDRVTQTFSVDREITALAFVFYISGEQPVGDLELELADAKTGELLAQSTGDMINIISGQYTGLGLSRTVDCEEQRTYRVTLTPHYTGEGRLSMGLSPTVVLPEQTLTVNDRTVDGTLALLVTCNPIGRFLSLYFWAIALLLTGILCAAYIAATSHKIKLHTAVFVLILLLGAAFTLVLPPYAAPDEQYHINQSFTLACQMANRLSGDEWEMTHIPTNYSYRRVGDVDETIQDSDTTVFTWRRMTEQLASTTDEPFDSHWEYSDAQVDNNLHLYFISAIGVLIGFFLHLGFVPVLLLGRLFNLVAFALFCSYAVRKTPVAKAAFTVAALLPMTLHLAASFSRDSLLLGLCFLFASLCLDAAFSEQAHLSPRRLALLLVLGLMIAPCKLVYFPLVALIFLIPAKKLGAHALSLRLGYLACCLVVFVGLNFSTFAGFLSPDRQAQTQAAAQQAAQDTLDAQQARQDADPAAKAKPSPQPAESAAASQAAESEAASQAAAPSAVPSSAPAKQEPESAKGITTRALVVRTYLTTLDQLPDEETIDFWATAMERKYTSLCGFLQPFFLSEEYHIQSKTDEELLTDFTYVLHDTAPTQEDRNTWLDYLSGMPTPVEKLNAYLLEYLNVHPYDELGVTPGDVDLTRTAPLYTDLQKRMEVKYAEDTSKLPEKDTICYNAAYIIAHPVDTLKLMANSVLENGDHYIRTLVGGSLSYYTLDIAWGWVVLLYLLLAAACITSPGQLLLSGRRRLLAGLCVLACCALAVLGCISWTPTYYTYIYGLQGRYFLPVLPLALAVLRTRRITAQRDLSALLLFLVMAANVGVLLNATLSVIAR